MFNSWKSSTSTKYRNKHYGKSDAMLHKAYDDVTHTSGSIEGVSSFFRKPFTTYLSTAGVNASANAMRKGTTRRANVRNPADNPNNCRKRV